MKRTGRKHRRRHGGKPQSGTELDAPSPPRPRLSERRFLIEMAVCLILTLIFIYFLNKETDAARRDCEARGGKFVVNRTDHRCEPADPLVAP
jgi:hypothetical protein